MEIEDKFHAHNEDLEMYVRGGLEPGHTSTVESHLSECQVCRGMLSKYIWLPPALYLAKKESQERHQRSEPRFIAGEHGILQELSPLCFVRQKIEIIDISRNGLGLLAPKSVWPGTIVQIRIKSSVELGEVRHCSMRGHEGYRIGLRLQSGQ